MTLIHRRLAVSVTIFPSSLSCQSLDRLLFDFGGCWGETRQTPGWVLAVATDRKKTQSVSRGILIK